MSGVLFYNKCRIKTDVLTDIPLTEAEEKDVNFYDYDGFRLLSYTNAEALTLTELPANPAINENLTFDEWNWTLVDIKTQINNVGGVVNVGAIYHTTDNKTHITCKPTVTFPNAAINLKPSKANDVVVDWGDGTTDTWTSTSQATKSHTYTGVTDSSVFDITISCTSGTFSFNSNLTGSSTDNKKYVFHEIKISNQLTSFSQQVFYNLRHLEYISLPKGLSTLTQFDSSNLVSINIPSTITNARYSGFSSCYKLKNIVYPSTSTAIAQSAMCYKLKSLTIPYNVNQLASQFCTQCRNLREIVIPNNQSITFGSGYTGCVSLRSIVLPDNVATFSPQTFYGCSSLHSIVIPENVTTIVAEFFSSCYSLHKIYMKPTTPPTLANTNAIPNRNNVVIYVPTGSLSDYQTAENWSTYASKMVEYNFN